MYSFFLYIFRMKKDDYEEEMKELLSSAEPLNITHLFSFPFPREVSWHELI